MAFLKAGGVTGDGEEAGDGERGEQTMRERFHGGNKLAPQGALNEG
jgi:hypothetical protein